MAPVPLAAWLDAPQAMAWTKPAATRPMAPAKLSALEWAVVALAERDTLSSLREPSGLAVALSKLFGQSRPNPLGTPRLEALRRIAVHAWRNHWRVPESELKAFVGAGFTLDQYELLQASIHQGRQSFRRRGVAK